MAALLASAPPAPAQTLFNQPSIGFTPPPVVRTTPPVTAPSVVRTVPPVTVPSLNANQCQLSAGSCPTGRLMRSGSRCYCASGDGTARQGASRPRPQDARPSAAPQ
ncbi:hypothetical protein OSH08_03975 [Kaistia geumhonensis]|uniref:Uncharacterized protein n=1 Tax=Kaistia geumhonensis TaxID=410839 RepID=A0ABU0M6Q1_9HYPH|nr:hypothetical protein [Kaistia geumhonensis]MCX5478148.1 hypothetical protein [Kaistia geumhonensis]MDQ0516636.1 hypothetical protein [Kaistia geumhonensis]